MAVRLSVLILALAAPGATSAAVLECKVTRKLDAENVYSSRDLERGQFSVLVEESSAGATLSRCSYSPSAGRVTCDKYRVDRIEHDANVNAKKFYVFRSHFDVQLFGDLTFIENNGRGGIAFGTCSAKSP